ncbi:hypothetical protein [Fulvivirga lutimaris]|uniref:hypothetical protein n=1 Tax=Fulvivirga lutimaris TaxID=1819566 RepID=UPI0012BC506B|nr:hypothetical protein [Fulvivirga lutimaris]MTI40663.1 hypothetical protein [Fulvivirga lutimaris]
MKIKFSKTLTLCFITLLPFVVSCSEEEGKPNTSCLLRRIVYDQTGSLLLETVSGGKIYQIKEQFKEGGKYKTLVTYGFKYPLNQVAIDDLSDDSTVPLILVYLDNNRPVKVEKYFSDSGVTLTHVITYEGTVIRDELNWEAKSGEKLKYGYADYLLDDNGNVVNYKQFNYGIEDQSIITQTEDIQFEYDESESPWDGLYFPFFANIGMVDIKFFSKNNIVNIYDKIASQRYDYQYNQSGLPTLLSVSGSSNEVEFEYINCGD